ERRLYQALAFHDVEAIYPVYLGLLPFKNPLTRKDRNIFTVGFRPTTAVLDRPGVPENLDKLRVIGNILFDENGRPEYGPIAETFKERGNVVTEIGQSRVEIVGL